VPEFVKESREPNCGRVQTIPCSTVTASCLPASSPGDAGGLGGRCAQRANYPHQLSVWGPRRLHSECPGHAGGRASVIWSSWRRTGWLKVGPACRAATFAADGLYESRLFDERIVPSGRAASVQSRPAPKVPFGKRDLPAARRSVRMHGPRLMDAPRRWFRVRRCAQRWPHTISQDGGGHPCVCDRAADRLPQSRSRLPGGDLCSGWLV
jgi:hypothetical protein